MPNSSPWYTYGVPLCRCRTVASVFAEWTRCSGESSPNRETARGWSWLSQYREFQPASASPYCQSARLPFSAGRDRGARSHFDAPGTWSMPMCSKVNTMFSSRRAGSVMR